MNIELRKLSRDDGREIYKMLEDLPQDENGFINPVAGKSYEDYKEWLHQCVLDSEETSVVDGWKVPQTVYWLFVDGEPAGIGKVRHFLTEGLRLDGGNVGYSVHPVFRNKGIGRIFLSMLIRECAKLGIDRALLTIDSDNIPSKRIALANNGVVEKEKDGLMYIWLRC